MHFLTHRCLRSHMDAQYSSDDSQALRDGSSGFTAGGLAPSSLTSAGGNSGTRTVQEVTITWRERWQREDVARQQLAGCVTIFQAFFTPSLYWFLWFIGRNALLCIPRCWTVSGLSLLCCGIRCVTGDLCQVRNMWSANSQPNLKPQRRRL